MAENSSSAVETSQFSKRSFDEGQSENGNALESTDTSSMAPTTPVVMNGKDHEAFEEPAAKRIKIDAPASANSEVNGRQKVKGIALVKPEQV